MELLQAQECPYCGYETEDALSNWEPDSEEEVECDSCRKTYIS
ncbi:hypothetical protein [Virgibacillus salexigens]|uniref:Small CPxCG-related zinc finger protein n=1 Tax=Virgibacillus massiliensis TaxID=1462526 RepID=A0A024QIV1_9BACI|nr:hypothetical protein [Virgibacillus massiliensis]CDQ41881.1 hypothetical protein BN990_04260 [Virgibacillus massiliensis]